VIVRRSRLACSDLLPRIVLLKSNGVGHAQKISRPLEFR